MTQEEKLLLFTDLSARLPYGVKINIKSDYTLEMEDTKLSVWHLDGLSYNAEYRGLKPYLRPMPSMTEEERKYIQDRWCYEWDGESFFDLLNYKGYFTLDNSFDLVDWLNAHHFDYRGLIEKGLALEAPADMYNN